MGNANSSDKKLLSIVEYYCIARPEFFLDSIKAEKTLKLDGRNYLFIETIDKRTPKLFLVDTSVNGIPKRVIPYFLINERPDRQILSYSLGKNLCNLSEIKEIAGRLYSRYADSYDPKELPHQDEIKSKIALWLHDCLTEDFDHHSSLNRKDISSGISISYDFGMSFSNSYFPPFYAWELGLDDNSIKENSDFLLELLKGYVNFVKMKEDAIISTISEAYSKTHNENIIRYLIRIYKTYFPMRLYYGRIFDKLKDTPFEKDALSTIMEVFDISLKRVNDWTALTKIISENRRRSLDLRGLDLSNVNMRRADLFGADIRGVNLTGADLGGADLRGADLRGARVEGANFEGVKREGIKFTEN
jgi:Pentapeptide repeats (8 copies)